MNNIEYNQAYVDQDAIDAYEARIAGEEDDGDNLDWEYDPSIKENHGKL